MCVPGPLVWQHLLSGSWKASAAETNLSLETVKGAVAVMERKDTSQLQAGHVSGSLFLTTL